MRLDQPKPGSCSLFTDAGVSGFTSSENLIATNTYAHWVVIIFFYIIN